MLETSLCVFLQPRLLCPELAVSWFGGLVFRLVGGSLPTGMRLPGQPWLFPPCLSVQAAAWSNSRCSSGVCADLRRKGPRLRELCALLLIKEIRTNLWKGGPLPVPRVLVFLAWLFVTLLLE